MPAKLNFFRRLQEGQRIDHTSAIVLARVRTQTAGQKIRRHQLSLQLPNISGVNAVQHTPSCNGALTSWGKYMGNVVAGDWSSGVPIYLNASASSSIYSKSSTVQPSSVCFLPCIKF